MIVYFYLSGWHRALRDWLVARGCPDSLLIFLRFAMRVKAKRPTCVMDNFGVRVNDGN